MNKPALRCGPLERREVPSADVAILLSTGLWKFDGETGRLAFLNPETPSQYGLDDAGNVYAVFGSLGFARYDKGTNALVDLNLGGATGPATFPSEIGFTQDGSRVYADFGGAAGTRTLVIGDGDWKRITGPSTGDDFEVGGDGSLYAFYQIQGGARGLFRFDPAAGTNLPVNDQSAFLIERLDPYDTGLFYDTGSAGVFKFDALTGQVERIDARDAVGPFEASDNGTLAVGFASGSDDIALWQYDPRKFPGGAAPAFLPLDRANPSEIAVDPVGNVYADFTGGVGPVERFDAAAGVWVELPPNPASALGTFNSQAVDDLGNLSVDFGFNSLGSAGLWRFDAGIGEYQQLNPNDPFDYVARGARFVD